MEGVILFHLDPFPCQSLDFSEFETLTLITERQCNSTLTSSCCPTDSVDIDLRLIWKVEVEDVRDIVHIDSSTCNICCNKNRGLSTSEIVKCSCAGSLRLVSMNRHCLDSELPEFLHQSVSTMLHANEHDCTSDIVVLDDACQKVFLVLLLSSSSYS